MVHTTINGREYELELQYGDETVVELLRGSLELTGTKLACGTGACGACTVLVDGRPMAGCLLPVQQIAGRDVHTVENHGPDNLHPVQRAFMANDALQCCFCTPGFINSAIAFYEGWRAEHGKKRPEREQIALALAGNLCRCGAYPAIYEAIAQALAGDFDADEPIEPPRYEALDKVTGRAKFTVDQRFEDQLEGVVLRSGYPHAKIVAIDASEALAMPGVVAFAELLESDRLARFAGQPIGALAAVDRRTARAALRRVKVVYDVYPAAVGPDRARQSDAPEVYQGFGLFRSPPNASEGTVLPGLWRRNRRRNLLNFADKSARKARRAVERARREDDSRLLELNTRNSVQVHSALEPHACLARWDGRERLTVYLSTQGVHHGARLIAEHFDLEEENVKVTAEHVGGAFGGKQGIADEAIAAITLAHQAGRPVRVVYDRLEEMSYAAHRPGAEVQLSLLSGRDGEVYAYSVESHGDPGIAAGTATSTVVGLLGPDVPRRTVQTDIVSHSPPGKPFRGPDGPQATWALESMADEAAYRASLDPITLRRRWYPDDPIRGQLLDWAEALPVWAAREEKERSGRFRRGVGLALGAWPFLYNGDSEVTVGATPGGFFVRVGTQDIGTGTRSILAGVVADVFGVAPGQVRVEMGFSDAPLGPTSGGSQVSNSIYGPTVAAAERLRDELLAAAKSALRMSGAEAVPGGIQHGASFQSWPALLSQVSPRSTNESRGSEPAFNFLADLILSDKHLPSIGRGLSKSITVTEVEVDTRLGRVRPLGVWMAVAAGKIFVPVLARSQIQGGIVQGLGYALYEERQMDLTSGFVLSANLEDYHIPGIADIPPMEVHFVEKGFDSIRGQGIGIAELATVGVAASVGNAVR
ncbi:MAG: molybdopterin-dependent oxidoreductase, partial [Chloroflexota bacterium]